MYAPEPRTRYLVQQVAPTTGATVVVNPSTTALWLNHTSLLAALTIELPNDPRDGQFFIIGAAQAVTVLIFTNGTVKGVLASIAINSFARFCYSASDGVWFRAG